MKADEIHQCNKCGLCLMHCPVYLEARDESNSPRGKVQLIRHFAKHHLESSFYLSDMICRCLMCGACTAMCPSGVEHNRLFRRMRSAMVKDCGQNWKMKVLFHLLAHEDQLHLAGKLSKYGMNWMKDHLLSSFRMGAIPLNKLPGFNAKPFRDRVAQAVEPEGPSQGTVLYFTGCATNYVYDEIGQAVVTVLTQMGYRVEIPKAQVCCGLPLFTHGNIDLSKANMLQNIKILNREDVAAVVVDCATCGSALRLEYAPLLDELGLDPTPARELASRVQDISEFVLHHIDLLKPRLTREPPLIHQVAYHAPCHLRNTQKVTSEVKELLTHLPNVHYVPVPDTYSCCGGGGSFFYEHPEISKKIVDKKIENARASGATIWATGCPSCQINLTGNLEPGDRLSVLHPIKLVEEALSGND